MAASGNVGAGTTRPKAPSCFVGRGDDLDGLLEALDAMPTVLLHGDGGVGKTSLAAAAADVLETRGGMRILWVSCREGWSLESVLLAAGRELEREGSQGARAALADPAVAPAERARTLVGLLAETPSLLVIDDAHVLETSFSADFPSWAGERLGDSRILVLSRRRPPWRGRSDRSAGAVCLSGLPDLDPASLPFVGVLDSAAAARLAAATGGRPLAMLLATLLVRGAGEGPHELADSLDAALGAGEAAEPETWLLERLLSSLGEPERAFLRSLAVFRIPVRRDALPVDATAETAAGRLRRMGLLTDDEGRWDMHPLVREIVRRRLGTDPALHRSAHDAMRRRAAAVEAEGEAVSCLREAFHHAYEADDRAAALACLDDSSATMERLGLAGELLGLIDACIRAGFDLDLAVYLQRTRLLRRLGRLEEADRELTRLRETGPGARLRAEIFWQQGQIQQDRNEYERAMRFFYRALEAAREADDPSAVARALDRVATVCKDRGDYGRARAFYLQGLKAAEEAGDRSEVLFAIHNLGRTAYFQGDFDGALELFARVEREAGDAGEPDAAALARNGRAEVLRDRGSAREASALFAENEGYYRRSCNRFGLAFTLRNEGDLDAHGGRLDAARARYEESLGLARSLGNPFGEAQSLLRLAELHRMVGDFERAGDELARGRALAERIGHRHGVAEALLLEGNLALSQGRCREASAAVEKSLELRETLGDAHGRAWSLLGKAALHRDRGELFLSERLYERSLRMMRDLGDRLGQAAVLVGLGSCERDRGRYDDAQARLAEAGEQYEACEDRLGRAMVLVETGHLSRLRGDYGTAIAAYEEAMSLRSEAGDGYGQADALEGVACIRCDQGRFADAEELFRRSLSLRRGVEGSLAHARGLSNLAYLEGRRGGVEEARRLHQESLEILVALENKREIQKTLGCLAVLHSSAGDLDTAGRLVQDAYRCARDLGDRKGMAHALAQSAALLVRQGRGQEATVLFESSLSMRRELGDARGVVASLLSLGGSCAESGDPDRARTLYEEAREAAAEGGFTVAEVEAVLGLAEVAVRTGRRGEAAARAEEVRERLGEGRAPELSARLSRLWGLLAAAEGRAGDAAFLLEYARDVYAELEDVHGRGRLDDELAALSKDGLASALDRRSRLLEAVESLDGQTEADPGIERGFAAVVALRNDDGARTPTLEAARWSGERGGAHVAVFSHAAAACRALEALEGAAGWRMAAHAGVVVWTGGEPRGAVTTLPLRLLGLAGAGQMVTSEDFLGGARGDRGNLETLAPLAVRERVDPLPVFRGPLRSFVSPSSAPSPED